jgi:ribosomal protein S6--L-glutamate ligase
LVRKQRERDLRALVVGGQAIAWVERRARPGRLLHTLARGAQLKGVRVPAALDQLASRTAQVLELELAAVDLIEGGDGPRVFDVHSSPGIEGMEAATGRDLALPIVARAEQLAQGAGTGRKRALERGK